MFLKRIRSYALTVTTVLVFAVASFSDSVMVFSDELVTIFANVGITNQPPLVTSITPSASPMLVAKNTYQTFSVQLTDADSSNILYTISTASGVLLPTSGTAPITGGNAEINFTYFAPSYKAKLVPIYLTLNDQSGSTPIVRQIDVYVY